MALRRQTDLILVGHNADEIERARAFDRLITLPRQTLTGMVRSTDFDVSFGEVYVIVRDLSSRFSDDER